MMKKTIVFSLIVCLFSACFGDKKSAIGTDFKDNSFMNKNFKGNQIEFAKITTPCNYVSKEELAKLYNVSSDKVVLIGGNQSSKGCSIRVKITDDKFGYITGGVRFYEELNNTSEGVNWIESWQVQKGISKSAEWISNLGKAAMYKSKKRELFIKLDNYTISITAPGSAFNEIEKSKKRDYKKIALTMAAQISLLKK